MKLTSKALSRFNDQLGRCPPAGSGVRSWIMSCASRAARAGISPAEAESAILQAMTRAPNPDNEVQAAIQKACAEIVPGCAGAWHCSQPKLSPRMLSVTARAFIHKGDGACEDDWLAASPKKFDQASGPHQALAMLDALYTEEDFVFCGEKYGTDVLAIWRLRNQIVEGEPVPPHFIPNPMTGRTGRTTSDKPSFRCNNSVAKFRFAVARIDAGLTKAQQLALWWGFDSAPLAALIDGGGDSIYAWLHVDCPDRAAWKRDVKETLFDFVLIPLGCNRLCGNESRLSRMPGHYRAENRSWQRLLYLNPEVEHDGRK